MSTINASSSQLTDVQNAVNSASNGDTVVVPAGGASWGSRLDITGVTGLTLQGAGIGQTVITKSLEVLWTDDPNIRITGFTFTGSQVYLNLWSSAASRIDHCRLVNTSGQIANLVVWTTMTNPTVVHPKGLIDHCQCVDGRLLTKGTEWLRMDGDPSTYRPQQDVLWHEQFSYGSDNYVFIEDNEFWATTFSPNSVADANYGGRFVFRHNLSHSGYLETHSVQGNNRSCRRWEIYENVFTKDNALSCWVPMMIRGGTGVCWNNSMSGYNNGPVLNNVRDTESREVCGACNGSSSWDQNVSGQGGWACRDQIGRGYDATQWIDGGAYTQTSDPAYIWGNTGNTSTFSIHNAGATLHIVQNRDYFLSAKPGYTPYTYPHPLQSGSVPPVEPPAKVGIYRTYG